MKKSLKIFSLIMVLCFLLPVAACGKKPEEEKTFSIDQSNMELKIDEQKTIVVTGADDATFISSDESVATVDGDGKVTGLNVGACKIKVTSGETSKYCTVRVTAARVGAYSIRFSRSEYLLAENSSFPLSVALYSGGDIVAGADINVVSSDGDVADIENGKIVAKAYGTATLNATCTMNGEVVKGSAKVKVVYRINHDPLIAAQDNYSFATGAEYVIADNISVTAFDGSQFNGSLNVDVYSDYKMTQLIAPAAEKFTVEKDKIYYLGITATSGEFESYKKIAVSDGKMLNGSYIFPECDLNEEFGANADTVSCSFVADDEYDTVLKVVTTGNEQPYRRGFVMKNLHKKAKPGQYIRFRIKFEKIVDATEGIFGYSYVVPNNHYVFSEQKVTLSKENEGKWADMYFLVKDNPDPDNWCIEFFDDGQKSGDLYIGLTYYIAEIGVVDSIA